MQLWLDNWEVRTMSKITEAFENKRNFYSEKGASTEEIVDAEKKLGVKFADDYKEYLKLYGSVSCAGHELTGISGDASLDVVNATLKHYKKNPNVKEPFYVVEDTHMDGIVIWQTESGEVFQSEYKEAPLKVYGSLVEYISSFEN